MKKLVHYYLASVVLMVFTSRMNGQELFVYTEPASNMPAKSLGIRASNWLMKEDGTKATNFHMIPEIMWGVNKNLMLHVEGFLSNRNQNLDLEGAAFYAKYRFLSIDKVNRHFRMAAYTRGSFNNTVIHQDEIEINGHNSGYEIGLIGTQLLHKQAVSVSVSYEKATDNLKGNKFPSIQEDKVINYSISTGRLILPKKYKNYGQTNLNLMLELLAQHHPGSGNKYLDIAPSVQFIFNSQARIDLGYKKHLYNNMSRTAADGFLLRLEYLFYNIF